MYHQIPFNPIQLGNSKKALSLGVAALLILATLLVSIPPAFATASTASVSPTTVDAKTATDLEFTVNNPSSSTASYIQIQIQVSARWAVIADTSVTTSGLGGTASVSVSGSGPYVIVVSGIALAPSASGKVKLLGMIADVGKTGATYTDPFNVYTLDATSGAFLQGATPSNPINVVVTVASGTATFIDNGMEPKATFAAPTLLAAQNLRAVVTAIPIGASTTGSTVTFIVAGRDTAGSSLVGKATVASGSAVAATATVTLLDGATAASFLSVEAVYIRTTAGVTGDIYKIQSVTTSTDMVTGIEAKDSTSGSLVAGQSINVAAYVTDNVGKGVSGQTVTFSTVASDSTEVTGGTYTASSVTTDALGAAKTIFTTSTKQGIQTMRARSTGLIGSGSSTNYKITTVWGSATTLSVTASPDSTPAVGGSSTITAVLKDANGNTRKVAAVTVNFGTTAGSLSASSAATAANGKATLTLSSTSTTVAGTTATITASAAGLTGSTTVSFTTGPIASVTISIDKTSMKIQETATITATAKDGNSNPVAGASMSFTRTVVTGLATYIPSISPSTVTTGADGKASTTLTVSIESGTLTITASSAGFSATTGTITISGGTATKLTRDSSAAAVALGWKSTIKADGTSTSFVRWILQDVYDNTVLPAAAIPITITTTGGTFSETGTATATDSISTATGLSSGVNLKSTTAVQKVTVAVTGGGLSGSTTVTFGADALNLKMSAKPSIVQVGTATTVTIQLIDGAGNDALAANAAVTVVSSTATAGTFGAFPTIAVLRTSGTFAWTAPATIPAGGTAQITVTARFTGATGTFDREAALVLQVSGVAFNMVLTPEPITAPADGTTIVKITAKLVDVSGVTIITSPATSILFSSTLGSVLTTTTATSTTTGIATAYIKAPSTAGLATITAVGGGVSGSLTYNFTTPGPVYKETSTAPVLKDTSGNPVTAPKVNTLVTVASTITNAQATAQQTLFIVQVKDSTGAVVSFSFVSGTIPAATSLEFAISWKPTATGTYTIQVFAWDSFTAASPLTTVQSSTVNVT